MKVQNKRISKVVAKEMLNEVRYLSGRALRHPTDNIMNVVVKNTTLDLVSRSLFQQKSGGIQKSTISAIDV